ncbi:AAA family ATPase [Bacillus subtilis]|uniref:AAA family ATPase n=1 Tax=Bacillus subtilis TaxID=1423 RepID=UPI001BD09FA9|nr:AAA family ATPase [Bacillus subtilis]
MAEIISFYSAAHSQGKRTVSLSLANLLAANGLKVLYFELDYKKPAVAISTQITDEHKNALNYFNSTLSKQSFDVSPYVLNKDHLLRTDDREMKKVYSPLRGHIEYLVFPLGFKENSFPALISEGETAEKEAQEYIEKMIYSLKTTKYDYVILNLPIELHSIFGYEVIINSDKIVNVVTPSSTRLFENKNAKTFLLSNVPDLEDKWNTVINMTSENIDETEYMLLVSDNSPTIVPFNPERQKEEFSLEVGSERIEERLEQLALNMGLSVAPSVPKKGFFRR